MSNVAAELKKDDPRDSKLSVADLKTFLKSKGMVQSGDKPTLWGRCVLYRTVDCENLRTATGELPYELGPADLKRVCARAGLSPIGSNDELLISLVEHLSSEAKKTSASSSSSSAGASAASSSSSSSAAAAASFSPVALAERVLSLSDESQVSPIKVLQLADPSLKASSPAALLRKAYLKLSLAIHPDRIGSKFREATKAFQVLVTCFERLMEPPDLPAAEESSGKSQGKKDKAARIERSNEGCYRTTVCCPRCKQAWGAPVEGNPDYFYNIMMMGLKSFTCATCLFQFGCMTALHKCVHCKGPFEYSPSDFHRKVSCGSPKCSNKTFGFHSYHMSDRALKDLVLEVSAAREKRAKAAATMKRRAESASRSDGGKSAGEKEAQEDAAFALGLRDECPRCGMAFVDMGKGEDVEREHLRTCTDERAIAANKEKKRKVEEKNEGKAAKQSKQDDVEALASWQFLGSKNEQLYLLSAEQLQVQCSNLGVVTSGKSKSSLISSLIAAGASTAITIREGTAGGRTGAAAAKTMPSIETMQRMDVEELKAVAAANGIEIGDYVTSKRDVLKAITRVVMGDVDAEEDKKRSGDVLMLTDGKAKKSRGGASKGPKKVTAKKKSAIVIDIDDSDDDDNEDDDDDYKEDNDDSD